MSDEQDQHPNVPDGWEVIQGGKAATPAPVRGGHDFKILGVNIHVPAEEQPRADSNIIGTPSGAGIAPEDLLMAGQAGRAVTAATKAGGALAGVGEAAAHAAPLVKYELVRSSLLGMGVPAPLAMAAAALASGYKGRGAAPAAEAAVPEGAHLDRSVPVPASSLTPQQLAERVSFGTGTPMAPAPKPPLGGPLAAQRAAAPVPPPAEPIATPATASPAAVVPQAPPALDTAGQPAITARPPVAASPNAGLTVKRGPTDSYGKSSWTVENNGKYLGSFDSQEGANRFIADRQPQPPTAAAQRTTGQIANAVDRAIGQAKVRGQISTDEFKALFEAVKAGKPADAALSELLSARATALTPAQQLAAMPGMMSDADVQAALAARRAAGAKSIAAKQPVLTPARMAELRAKFGGTQQ